jgi:hypothetical protein
MGIRPRVAAVPLEFDIHNYVARGGGLDEGEGDGFDREIEETIAVIAGASVTVAAHSVTFDADSDTYRDLAPDGTWTITAVDVGGEEPRLTNGLLRVGVTRTGASGVLYDRALCSYSIPFGDPIPLPIE